MRTYWARSGDLREADSAIREAIAFVAGVPEDSLSINVVPSIDPSAREHLAAARALRDQAASAQAQASAEIRQAARTMADSGLSLRDIGTILELSHQRVHQLLAEEPQATALPRAGT